MNIQALIPQREPIIMIDKIISHSEAKTIASLTVKNTNLFVEENIFQSSGLIEHIAQSAAARMGIQTVKKGRKPLLGYIASIKDLNIICLPVVGESIQTEIIITNKINHIIVVKAESRVEDTIVANCELKVFIEN